MAKQQKKQEAVPITAKANKPVMAGISIRWYAIIVFAFSFLIYFNSAFNDYNLDDELVTRNQRLTSRGISAIPDIFDQPYYRDLAGYEYEYRPMVLTSFAIEHSFFGESAFVSHIINVLMYAGMCAFLFYILLSIFQNYSILLPFAASLLFAAHPIHTEVVASIKNRDELMAMLFGLGAMWFSLQFIKGNSWWKLLLVPGLFLLGMLSKTTTITFAILIPLTIILFTNASFARVIIVTTVLAVPAVLLSRMPSIFYFIFLTLALYIVVVLLYVIKHRESTIQFVKKYMADLTKAKVEQAVEADELVRVEAGSLYSNPFLIGSIAFTTIVLSSISAWGISLADPWVAGVPLLVLTLVYAISVNNAKLIMAMPIGLLTVYMLVRMYGHPVFEGLLIAFIAMQILDKDKRFRITGWSTFVVYAAATLLLRNHTIFLALLFFAGFFNRRLMKPSLVLAGIWLIVAVLRELDREHLELKYISFPVLYVVMYLIWTKRTKYLQQVLVMLIPLVAMVYFKYTEVNNYQPVGSVFKRTYVTVNSIKAPDFVPVKSIRPLKYLEYPFDGTEPFSVKLGTSMVVLGKYLKLISVPYPMSFYYGFAYIDQTDLYSAGPIIVLLLYIVMLFAGLYFIRSRPLLSFGLLFYVIAIVPYTGVVIPVPGMLGDRFLLVPSVGFVVLVVYVLSLLFKVKLNKGEENISSTGLPARAAFMVLLLIYSGVTIARNQDWENHVQLFSKDVKVVENSVQANNLLGVHLLIKSGKEKDLNVQEAMRLEAIAYLKKSLELYPPYLNTSFDIGRTYGIMGEQYKALGNTAKAAQAYDSAAVYFINTTKIDSNFVTPYYSLGMIAQGKGDYQKAILYFEKYVKKYPDHQDASTQLSYTYFLLKNYDKAIEASKQFLARNPVKYEPMVNIAKTYLEQNNLDSAVIYFEKAYDLNRGNANMVKMLFDVSSRMGDEKRKQFYGIELNRISTRR